MWLLLIIFLSPPIMTTQELNRYETKQACQIERDRIGYLMAEQYPSDANFVIVCRLKRQVV